jgi:PAS domain S-box-containing protein
MPDDGLRLEALARYGVVDSPPEQQFDATVEMVARLAGAPIAALTFVDGTHECVKAVHGAELPSVGRAESFGALALASDALVIADTHATDRFAGHPWVTGPPGVRFCAAVAIASPGGLPLGTLTVMDTRPRDDGEQLIEALTPAVCLVEGLLERRRESELASALTCVVDFSGRFVEVSRAWADLLGVSQHELIGRRFIEFVHPDDVDVTLEEATLRQGEGAGTHGFENRYVTADGEVRWLAWESRVVGEEERYYAVAKDITELKQGDLALRESEERYRVLAENSTDMIARHGPDGRVEYVSSAAEAMLGYTPEELTGIDPYEIIHPEDRATVRGLHDALLSGTERARMVFRERHRDGHWVWLESMASLLRDASGACVGIHTATRDISETKRANDALQAAEERFRKAFDDAPIGMAIVGPDGVFQRVNRALGELLGYSDRELLARSIAEVTHPGDRRSGAEVDELLSHEARAATFEKRLVRNGGSTVWVSLSISRMLDSAGEPMATLAQFLDVSERHRAELEARRAREAAERANRAKSAFLARMSHELRTPLNAILGFAQLLELEDLTPEQLDSAARIVRGGAHLVELLDDVLDISRIEAGEMSMELAPVRVGPVIDEVVALLRPLAGGREIELKVDRAGADACACADRQRLKQVLLNLVSNAIKYGPERSEVAIGVSCDHERVRLTVRDQGPGIAPEAAARVFLPFERLPEHARVEGTGLGLALSRNLTHAMAGTIGVDPSGTGSEFWVELEPAEPEPGARTAPEADDDLASAPPADARTVLYVEDSPANVEFTRRLMATRPHVELVVAGDIATARTLIRDRRPDAVMLDIDLPDGDGGDFLAELKADPSTASIPVLVVTADARAAQEERVMAAGAAAYAAKPIDVRAFMRGLDAALAG